MEIEKHLGRNFTKQLEAGVAKAVGVERSRNRRHPNSRDGPRKRREPAQKAHNRVPILLRQPSSASCDIYYFLCILSIFFWALTPFSSENWSFLASAVFSLLVTGAFFRGYEFDCRKVALGNKR